MTTIKTTKYDKLEQKFVETAQEMLDNFGINKDDLKDILDDQTEEETQCCWDEEKKEWYGTESISPSEDICLGCRKRVRK